MQSTRERFDNVQSDNKRRRIQLKFDNKFVIGFNNGLYDLNTGKFYPEIKHTMTTGTDYLEYDFDSDEVQFVMKFFSEIQPDPDSRNYLLTFMASCLDGNINSDINVWTGSGNNGKSAAADFFAKAFGNYVIHLPISLLTSRHNILNSKLEPMLANTVGKRFALFSEPNLDEKINVDTMKELSNAKYMSVRQLYSKTTLFKQEFKTLLVSNSLPVIPSLDKGTWQRLRNTPFETQFVSHDNVLTANQMYKDYELYDKMEDCKEALIWYLLNHYYPKYRLYGLKPPSKVIEHFKQ